MQVNLYELVSELLDKEVHLYEDLRLQVDRELEAIDEGDMSRLMGILQSKQAIISKQEILLERWEPVSDELGITDNREGKAFWKSLAEAVGDQGYKNFVVKIKKLRDLASMNLSSERIAQDKLEVRVKELRARMTQMANGKKAVRGYMGNSSPSKR